MLKIIIAVLLTWILLVVTNLIRLATSDGYIQLLVPLTHMAYGCGESRSECGIGYSFLELDNTSWHYDKEKPDSQRFSVLGKNLYKKR